MATQDMELGTIVELTAKIPEEGSGPLVMKGVIVGVAEGDDPSGKPDYLVQSIEAFLAEEGEEPEDMMTMDVMASGEYAGHCFVLHQHRVDKDSFEEGFDMLEVVSLEPSDLDGATFIEGVEDMYGEFDEYVQEAMKELGLQDAGDNDDTEDGDEWDDDSDDDEDDDLDGEDEDDFDDDDSDNDDGDDDADNDDEEEDGPAKQAKPDPRKGKH
ncbi:MAG: hypothetical protein GMKNLPBB_01074 [Myxococcota bacterium]|nr:hypothetical protein [Myxococcota bacterium]